MSKKKQGCLFCKKPKENKDRENLILYQSRYAFVMMNKFPYNNGHLMVVPKRHCIYLDQLNDDESQDLFLLLKTSIRILKKTFHPHGFNLGMNIGKIGGAGEKHIHFHIVPRWIGDTNFMPVLGETKIIPEYLEKSYDRLHSAFKELLAIRKGQKGGRKN